MKSVSKRQPLNSSNLIPEVKDASFEVFEKTRVAGEDKKLFAVNVNHSPAGAFHFYC